MKPFIQSIFLIFLMGAGSNLYAKKFEAVDAQAIPDAARTEIEQGAADAQAACAVGDNCDVAADDANDSLANQYGGIKQEYVVKGCKVTIYNDGPVKMVTVKTDEPCDAPLPKGHQFSQ